MSDSIFGDLGETEVEDSTQSSTPGTKKAEGDGTSEEETDQNLPFHEHPRWKEVYTEAKRVPLLVQELEELKRQVSEKEVSQVAEKGKDAWEPKTWDEVLQMAEQRVLDKLNGLQEEIARRNAEADKQLAESLAQLKAEKGEFDEPKLLQTALKYGISDVTKAWDIMQMEAEAERRGEKIALKKTMAPVGSSAKTEGGIKSQPSYKTTKSRSLDQIVADAVERISS